MKIGATVLAGSVGILVTMQPELSLEIRLLLLAVVVISWMALMSSPRY